MAGLYVPGRLAVGDTVKHSRMIGAAFDEAADYVDWFRVTNDRLPSKEEFSAWAQTQPKGAYSVDGVSIWLTPPVEHDLGPVPPGSYLLGFWRGEWYEFFAGWSRETTLELDPNVFYLLGSFWGDLAAWILLGITLLLVSRRVSPNRHLGCPSV